MVYDESRVREAVAQARAGNGDPLHRYVHQQLCTRHYALTIKKGYGRDWQDVDQEFHIRLTKAMIRYEDRGVFDSWVYSVFQKVLVAHHRARKRRPWERLANSSLPSAPDTRTPSPSAQAADQEFSKAFDSALAHLTMRDREVFRLRSNGDSFPDIGATLGQKEDTVKQAFRRAIPRVEAHLRRRGFE
jgi:RNA polymerase sigma factor (sigma-70 family)